MKIIEQSPERLVLRYRCSLWLALLFAITFIPGGLFALLIGLAIDRTAALDLGNFYIMPVGFGIIFSIAGFYFSIKFAEITTATFDKSKQTFTLTRKTICQKLEVNSIELSLNAILGIEVKTIESHSADSSDVYQIEIVLDSSYYRIPLHLNADSYWQQKVRVAKTIANFLNITYFSGKPKAPAAKFQDLSNNQIQAEIERSQTILSQHPNDPEAHENLGLLLYQQHKRKNRKAAIAHLQQAEIYFASQSNLKVLEAVRAIKTLTIWQKM
ncbi:MAG: hypothetical protein KME17_00510 [Cyanosarcina radialis HA8281-LM2]|jgi:hypothetical protein|nr:hypothetical protein [Cyanosarcina radialis HA8281-LM2]